MSNETIAEVLARKYSDDDLNVIIQDWDHTDADQAVSIALAADLLRERTSRREKERSLAAGKVATIPSPEQIAAWATGWRQSDELDEPLSAEDQMIWRISYAVHCGMRDAMPTREVNNGEVLVEVHGLTGSGKSAVAGEIEILCKALGLQVRWENGDEEKRMTHADWTSALELYNPRVRIVEVNTPRPCAAPPADPAKASGSAPDDEGPEGEDGPWASGWDERSRPTREPFTDGRLQSLIDHHETWIASAKESGFADAVTFHTDCLAVIRNLATPPASAPNCKRCGATTGAACDDHGCGYLNSGNGEPASAPEVTDALMWLRSALDCPTFAWDADQRAAAEAALTAALQERSP